MNDNGKRYLFYESHGESLSIEVDESGQCSQASYIFEDNEITNLREFVKTTRALVFESFEHVRHIETTSNCLNIAGYAESDLQERARRQYGNLCETQRKLSAAISKFLSDSRFEVYLSLVAEYDECLSPNTARPVWRIWPRKGGQITKDIDHALGKILDGVARIQRIVSNANWSPIGLSNGNPANDKSNIDSLLLDMRNIKEVDFKLALNSKSTVNSMLGSEAVEILALTEFLDIVTEDHSQRCARGKLQYAIMAQDKNADASWDEDCSRHCGNTCEDHDEYGGFDEEGNNIYSYQNEDCSIWLDSWG